MNEGASGATALTAVLEEARRRGFLGPGPLARHVDHARGFALAMAAAAGNGRSPEATPLDAPGCRVLDLGSGGGIPGLVVAVDHPAARVVLVDASTRRCAWLHEASGRLGLLDRVSIGEGRGEDLARRPELRGQFDVVTARSFATPATTAEIGGAFLRVGGVLVVSEPPPSTLESPDRPGPAAGRWSAPGLATLGLRLAAQTVVAGGTYAVIVRQDVVPDRFPRRSGIPSKRALW